jgi:hypothetical protein
MTDEDALRAADAVIVEREAAAARGRDTPDVDKSRCNQRAFDALGELAGRLGDVLGVIARDPGEHRVQPLPVFEAERRDVVFGGRGNSLTQLHQSIAVRKGQRAQQHSVERREHRAVGADAERKRQNDRERECGRAAERAQRVAHIAQKRIERE